MTIRHRRWLLALLLPLALLVAACGDSDDDGGGDEASTESDPSTGGGDDGTPGLDPEFVERFQGQLADVGCYSGPIDGIDGAGTLAATRAFQAAKGLTEDGIVGSETEEALADAVENGEAVCSEPADADDGDGALDGDEADADDGEGALDGAGLVTVDSQSYGNDFVADTCSLEVDLDNAFITATNDADLTFELEVLEGVGTLAIDGGNESDGIILNGDITELDVSADRSFTANGTFTAPNNEGDPFTVSGTCP